MTPHAPRPLLAALVLALGPLGAAHAQMPASLKASCTTLTPAPGFGYMFCDDGVPPTGGLTPNIGGTNAVLVPAKYDGFAGLPPKSADANMMPGADPTTGDIALDVDVSIPTLPAPPGGYPLVVMMHGCCSGDRTSWESTTLDPVGEGWHYNNAWFASRGYVVLTYTARGFVNGMNQGSTGETELDSRNFEINDFQYLAGLIADDPFFDVNPQKVVVTGGSYGGGFAWLAFTDPIWTSPGGKPMKLAAAAPRYGWTDLVFSLVPNGAHSFAASSLPAFDGSDTITPLGIPKQSINAVLYASGKTGIPPGSNHTTFPPEVDAAFQCLQASYPFDMNPSCATTISTTLPEFINDRSAYYQTAFFTSVATDPAYRTPLFNAGTLTDPLFTPIENVRMVNRLKSLVSGYPVQEYYGDYEHFVQNKAKEWADVCGTDHHVCMLDDYPGGNLNKKPLHRRRTGVTSRLNRFVDFYAQPPGDPNPRRPHFDVTASLQICPQNATTRYPADEPGRQFRARSFAQLGRGTLVVDMPGMGSTMNKVAANGHALDADPLLNFVAHGGQCPVETSAAGTGVATYESDPLPKAATMLGAALLSIDYMASTATGLELNARVYDLFPDGTTAVMVDRGVRSLASASGTVDYYLHGNGWQFPAGHKIRIEVAQDDGPYVKASDTTSTATLTRVTLRIPTREGSVRTVGGTSLP